MAAVNMPQLNQQMFQNFMPNIQIPIPSMASDEISPDDDGDNSPSSDGQENRVENLTPKEPNRPSYRNESWFECFTTTSHKEFEALIYSVYVTKDKSKKTDDFEHYECFNRLQSKCRYRVRTKQQNEFYIVEEKGAHNHAMEPVGTPGTHAGLPKTLREIVDQWFAEEWPIEERQRRIEEEVRRMGLPHNPRLNRQIDNRVAYLRRVKNLTETKKMQDQGFLVDGAGGSFDAQELGMLDLLRGIKNDEAPSASESSQGEPMSAETTSMIDLENNPEGAAALSMGLMDPNFLQSMMQSAQEQGLDAAGFANLMQNLQQLQQMQMPNMGMLSTDGQDNSAMSADPSTSMDTSASAMPLPATMNFKQEQADQMAGVIQPTPEALQFLQQMAEANMFGAQQ